VVVKPRLHVPGHVASPPDELDELDDALLDDDVVDEPDVVEEVDELDVVVDVLEADVLLEEDAPPVPPLGSWKATCEVQLGATTNAQRMRNKQVCRGTDPSSSISVAVPRHRRKPT
jgi:hypothetical protein